MIFTNTITLILALVPATVFAAPTKTVRSMTDLLDRRDLSASILKVIENGNCDLSLAKMPTGKFSNSSRFDEKHQLTYHLAAPTPLPAPGAGYTLSHVAIGRGTQNYTCKSNSASETPVANGAIATLFNATCSVVRAPSVLNDITVHALDLPIPTSETALRLTSGHHEFTVANAPFFNLNTDAHKYGTIIAKKNATSDPPSTASKGVNGLGSVSWLKLTAVEGDFKEVYRLNTAGGVAPKTCQGQNADFTIEYAAEYWFFK